MVGFQLSFLIPRLVSSVHGGLLGLSVTAWSTSAGNLAQDEEQGSLYLIILGTTSLVPWEEGRA